jgi:hypothetical protein
LSGLTPSQLAIVCRVVQAMLDPVSRAIANAPFDDEPETQQEREAVSAAKKWFENNPNGIPFEEVLADFGLTLEDIRSFKTSE